MVKQTKEQKQFKKVLKEINKIKYNIEVYEYYFSRSYRKINKKNVEWSLSKNIDNDSSSYVEIKEPKKLLRTFFVIKDKFSYFTHPNYFLNKN